MSDSVNRRDFLQRAGQTAALTAGVAALGGVHTEAAEQPSTIQLGMIGCGTINQHLINNYVDFRGGWFGLRRSLPKAGIVERNHSPGH